MHPLHNYIKHLIDEDVFLEEKKWYLNFRSQGSVLNKKEFSKYIPTLFALLNNEEDSHPYSLEIHAVLQSILPKQISADQARMALAPLKDEEFEDADVRFDLLDKLTFPADTDITILEDTLDHDWYFNSKYSALRIITEVTGSDTESYLIERLRKNLRQRIASNGYQPDYRFIYDALGDMGSIKAIPSLMADRDVNRRYRHDIDVAIEHICEREQISEEFKGRLMDPDFWKFEWNGTHTDFAAFVLLLVTGLDTENGQKDQVSNLDIIASNLDAIATALAKEVNLDLHPHASVSDLMRETLNDTALDRLEQFTDFQESEQFADQIINDTKVSASCPSPDEDIMNNLFREYFVTRIGIHFNIIR